MINDWESRGMRLRVIRMPSDAGYTRKGYVLPHFGPQHYSLHEAKANELCLAAWFFDARLHTEDWSEDVYNSMLEHNFLENVLVPSLLNTDPPRYVTAMQSLALKRAGFKILGLVLLEEAK